MTLNLIVNLELFGHDVDALSEMLAQQAKLMPKATPKAKASQPPINRQLLMVAVSARQFMDFLLINNPKDSSGDRKCGDYLDRLRNGKETPGQLTFYQACNSIIHAQASPCYGLISKPDTVLLTIAGTKSVTIKGKRETIAKETNLNSSQFLTCCSELIKVLSS